VPIPLNSFFEDDSGGASVEWVVLSAAVVGMAAALAMLVLGGYKNLSLDTRNALANTRPVTEPFAVNEDITAGNDTVLQ
jgi:hypothetical protein